MKRKLDRVTVITVFTVVALTTIATLVIHSFTGSEHNVSLCIASGLIFFVVAICANWLVRRT
jgi:hypothetical protein